MSLLLKAVFSAILSWITGLIQKWKREREIKEQGRAEVREAVKEKTNEIKDEWAKIDRDGIDSDTAIDRLRDRAKDRTNNVPKPKPTDK